MGGLEVNVTASARLDNSVVVAEIPAGSIDCQQTWVGRDDSGQQFPIQATSASSGAAMVGIQVASLDEGSALSLRLEPDETPDPRRGIVLGDQAENGRIVVNYSGFLQTIYHYGAETFKPRFYPITAPCARLGDIDSLSTVYPKGITDDSPPDHIWHRSLWYACGDVNGVDFYLENGGEGKIVHKAFSTVFSGPLFGGFRESLAWTTPAGKTLIDDERTFMMYRLKGTVRIFDIGAKFTARAEPVTFGATNENALPLIRVADAIDEWDGGTITLSDGTTGGKAAFGHHAEWADCSGPLARTKDGGPWIWGIAMLDHPSNRNHPNAWFARSYGPLGTNTPFFDGALTLEPGESWELKHRIIVHEGTPEEAQIASRFAEYANPASIEIT